MGEWIAVDLDGTLITYDDWVAWNVFGEPVPLMVERVRKWLADGKEVRIFTARVAGRDSDMPSTCQVTGEAFTPSMMTRAIQDHLEKIGLPRLACTATKDYLMTELWDDRCVQVVKNTGRTLAEEHEAERQALAGAAWQPDPTDDDSLDPTETARLLSCSAKWLENGRREGYGPKFIRVSSRAVRYRRGDIRTWMKERTFQRTSEHRDDGE